MQRIPVMDVFGSSRRMGEASTEGGTSVLRPMVPGQVPGAVMMAQAAPKQETALRFEFRDAEDNYVPGVSVKLSMEDGTKLVVLPPSDIGGNVSVPFAQILERVQPIYSANPAALNQKIVAEVVAPGYADKSVIVYDPAIPKTDDPKRFFELTLEKSAGIPPVAAVLGIAAAIGMVVWAVK